MDFYYKKFLESISLSATQVEDGRKKYRGVCDCLAHGFYERDLKDSDKILFGSFKTKTQVLPMGCNQDVDVVFKISEEIFEKYKTRPGDMLQKVRSILKGKYTTTDKISAWGKVVLVDFCEGCHDVEVAPCFEQEDGTFLIPNNYENDVDWELFDVRGQISDFETSNNASNGLTRELVKLIKKWARNTSSLSYSSYNIMNDVIGFVNEFYASGRGNNRYDVVVKDFFTSLLTYLPSHLSSYKSHVETAKCRAVKANSYEDEGKHIEATEECKKIFGDSFPKADYNDKTERACATVLPVKPWGVN